MTLFLDYLGTVSELNHEYDCAEFDPGRIRLPRYLCGKGTNTPDLSHTQSAIL